MSRNSSPNVTGKLDKAAVALSGLCLVHCLALPLIVALFPIFGAEIVDHATFHQIILIVVVPTTVLALGAGYNRHRRLSVPILGALGVVALVVAAFAVHALGTELAERGVTVAGGLLIAAAHIQNFRLTRAQPCHRHARAADEAEPNSAPDTPPMS